MCFREYNKVAGGRRPPTAEHRSPNTEHRTPTAERRPPKAPHTHPEGPQVLHSDSRAEAPEAQDPPRAPGPTACPSVSPSPPTNPSVAILLRGHRPLRRGDVRTIHLGEAEAVLLRGVPPAKRNLEVSPVRDASHEDH